MFSVGSPLIRFEISTHFHLHCMTNIASILCHLVAVVCVLSSAQLEHHVVALLGYVQAPFSNKNIVLMLVLKVEVFPMPNSE